MARLAPMKSWRSFSTSIGLVCGEQALNSKAAQSQEILRENMRHLFEVARLAKFCSRQCRINLTGKAGQHAAGSDLDKPVHTQGGDGPDRFGPANGIGHLLIQTLARFPAGCDRLRTPVGYEGKGKIGEMNAIEVGP